MAQSTKYATPICLGLTLLAIIGIMLGIALGSAVIPIIFLIPTVAYEIYRTDPGSTKISSIILMIVLVAELVFLIFNISWNLADFLGTETKTIAGYTVTLGDIRVVSPILMAVLSVVLFVRTYGVYTKWLAVIIFVTSFGIIYCISPAIFTDTFRTVVQEAFDRVSYW